APPRCVRARPARGVLPPPAAFCPFPSPSFACPAAKPPSERSSPSWHPACCDPLARHGDAPCPEEEGSVMAHRGIAALIFGVLVLAVSLAGLVIAAPNATT